MLVSIVLSVNPNAENYFKNKRYSFEEFCAALEQPNVAKALGCSYATLSKYLRELFPDRPKMCRVEFWLLKQSEYKRCKHCNTIKERNDFRLNKSKSDGLNDWCHICHSAATLPTQKARQRKYEASKLQRIPKWADLKAIKEIYDSCPKGYHVDHIVPLQGENVSGLHVENNLQYLIAIENITKGNKYAPEV